MIAYSADVGELALETRSFYRRAVRLLNNAGVPFLLGGAYALAQHAGIGRHTKDFDVFLRARDFGRGLDVFAEAGYRTERTFEHWLGKAFHGDDVIDLIFSSGNGLGKVDELWFDCSIPVTFLGEPVRLCPAEEMIWQKAFICERERFDGADVNHLLLTCGRRLDWERVVWRFGPHWRVLAAHLTLFAYTYPSQRDVVPGWVTWELTRRQREELATTERRRVCQGTLLSRTQYVVDLESWGYADARLDHDSGLTPDQASVWTEAGLNR